MMSSTNLFYYFEFLFLSWLNVFLFIVGILIIYFIVIILKYKRGTDYKIYNFYQNGLYIVAYIGVFILLLFYIRYLTWGNSTDLQVIFYKTKDLYQHSLGYFIIKILFFVFILVSIFKIKYLLTQEIIKRHLYLFYTSKYMKKAKAKFSYEKFIKRFHEHYSYEDLFYTPIWAVAASFHLKSKEYKGKFGLGITKLLGFLIYKKQRLRLFVRLFPFQLLIYLIIYDCYMNNFVISKVFYYLPFYLLYTLWYNASEFLRNTDNTLNRILYERYYEEDEYAYINTTEEEDNYIFSYIKNRFQILWTSETYNILVPFQISIIQNRRYTRDRDITNEKVYENSSTGDRVNFAELIETDLEQKVNGKFISNVQGKLLLIHIILMSYLINCSSEYTIQIAAKLLPENLSFLIILLFMSLVIFVLMICIVSNFRGSNVIFFGVGFVLMGLLSFIIIKTNILFLQDELILDYGIKLIKNISVDEKIEFMKEYFKYLVQFSTMQLEKKMYIISVFNSIDLETISKLCSFEEVSIIRLKEYTLNLLYLINEQHSSYYLLLDLLSKNEIYLKFDTWSNYVITLIILKNAILISKCIINLGLTESMPIIIGCFQGFIWEIKEVPIIKGISYLISMCYYNKEIIKDIIVR
jgi:hypothetical protein